MTNYTLLFAVLLLGVAVNGRHYSERSADADERDDQIDNVRRGREHGAGQMRHRRRSWQMNYGYDYPQPQAQAPYYPDRRDYDRNQQELLPQIYRLLDEISALVRRPSPPPLPPQPIYVPYPVPYPMPQQCNCQPTTANQPNITSRFPDMEDSNQNWGFADANEEADADDSDGSRPISFVPIVPKRPSNRQQPKVEHGTTQAGGFSTQAPSLQAQGQARLPVPDMCAVVSLSCCSGMPDKERQCFNNAGCIAAYNKGNACNQDRILSILDAYSKAYSPVN